jgi:hypothetical protein
MITAVTMPITAHSISREIGAEQIHRRRVTSCGDRQRDRYSPQGERTVEVSIAPDRRTVPLGRQAPIRSTRDMINGEARTGRLRASSYGGYGRTLKTEKTGHVRISRHDAPDRS